MDFSHWRVCVNERESVQNIHVRNSDHSLVKSLVHIYQAIAVKIASVKYALRIYLHYGFPHGERGFEQRAGQITFEFSLN